MKLVTDNTEHLPTEIEQKIWDLLGTVCDPEVPVLTILDLGIVRHVTAQLKYNNELTAQIYITPTYTGCPAMDIISMQIKMVLLENGIKNHTIHQVLSPAWTTDWMTETGKQKLKAYGIAAPNKNFIIPTNGVECPQCNSINTTLISEFGSTACKSLYQCSDCKEPFDYFKCH